MFEDSVTYLYVVDVASGLSDDTDGPEELPSGAGAFFNAGDDDTEQSDITSSTDKFYFGYRTDDGILHKSPTFRGSEITNETRFDTASLTEQISYLGYNGTSGEMDDSDSTYFGLKMVLNHTFGMLNNSPLVKTIPYKTVSSSSQEDLTLGLVQAGYNAFKNKRNPDIIFDAVCNVAYDSDYDFDNDITVVNGSKTFTVDTDIGYNADSGDDLAVGDYVRLGTTAKIAGTPVVTSPVYKVTAIDSRVVTVDRPINVASDTYTTGENQVIPAATGLAADWGIRMDGNTPDTVATGFNPRTDTPYVVSFDVLSDDFDTAEVTYSTDPDIGSGTYQLVASMEAYTQFQNKGKHLSTYPMTDIRIDAEPTKGYDIFSFEIWDNEYVSATTGINPISKGRIVIAAEESLGTDIGYYATVLGVSAPSW